MVYISPFKDIIYPAATREPRVARYRIVLAGTPTAVRAIVHLLHGEPSQPQQPDLDVELDVVLNRIVNEQLVGIPLDCIQLVVQAGLDLLAYPIRYNALEFRHPGRTVKRSGGTRDEPVHIRSHDVTGGSVAFYVDRDGAKPVAAKIARILR
ncbi:hypothetical protein [Paraburkholderia domus]|uniref:hypothetical protein n=1 Tax=Paraburkholderia domus TaxID=2793075 RepID=UPI001913AB51|nr:hypothetical protein [Paraburkholderia domus]MBK5066406.1 hypothetical protein [Burkholderia sp. R-70199]CAE6970058.1 hypothetical protein R70199_08142 [Paraburkholderia domus]